jgi:hypothetical protein
MTDVCFIILPFPQLPDPLRSHTKNDQKVHQEGEPCLQLPC